MLKLGVIFGGMSTENEVSVASGKNVLENLNKDKYEIYPIYIAKSGEWFEYKGIYENLNMKNIPKPIQKIDNIIDYLNQIDLVFPVLHGLYGEDGTIQGMLELFKIPYVGCNVLSSSIGMDKVYTKIIFEKAGINQTKSCYIKKFGNKYIYINGNFDEETVELKKIHIIIERKIKYPMFVKPSNSGSSVGVSKVETKEELQKAIEEAAKFDSKILIEEGINGREVECAVLGNNNVIAGEVGEIIAADTFYSYDAKYNNIKSETVIPAEISEKKKTEVKNLAIKAFKAIDGKGLSRVDFFIENKTEKVFLNEINTMPGFTSISMYPQLMNAYGIKYSKLLDKLIELALEKF